MFVQVIRGRTNDAAGLMGRLDIWRDGLMAGATGFLGSTAGVATDGEVFVMARFADEPAARANEARPEQKSWWEATASLFDGEASFSETTDVEEAAGGGSDDTGFVQVIASTITDRAAFGEVTSVFEKHAPTVRPEYLGGLSLWFADDGSIEIAYFRSEAEARAGESAELPDELAAAFAKMQSLLADPTFIDLTDPRTLTP
jgi:hypothetical protein